MQKIATAKGKEYSVEWCGVSTIDFALRFAIKDVEMSEIIMVFMNPENTSTIIHTFDEYSTPYNGYTGFRGVDLKPDGSIVVALTQES